MTTQFRLSAVPLQGIALLSLGDGVVQFERALIRGTPLVDAIVGRWSSKREAALRATVGSERYVLTQHCPDEAFLREGNVVRVDEVLEAVKRPRRSR